MPEAAEVKHDERIYAETHVFQIDDPCGDKLAFLENILKGLGDGLDELEKHHVGYDPEIYEGYERGYEQGISAVKSLLSGETNNAVYEETRSVLTQIYLLKHPKLAHFYQVLFRVFAPSTTDLQGIMEFEEETFKEFESVAQLPGHQNRHVRIHEQDASVIPTEPIKLI